MPDWDKVGDSAGMRDNDKDRDRDNGSATFFMESEYCGNTPDDKVGMASAGTGSAKLYGEAMIAAITAKNSNLRLESILFKARMLIGATGHTRSRRDTDVLCVGSLAGGNLTVFYPYQVLRHIHDTSIMRGKNKGCLEASVDILHQLEYSSTCFMIQIRGRLVGQYHLWLRSQRARDGYTLALASAELIWAMSGKSGQIHNIEIAGYPAATLRRIQFLELQQGIFDILFGRQNRKKVESLKYEANGSGPKFREFVGRLPTHILAIYKYFSAGRRIDTTDKVEQRGFAAPGWARYRHEGSILNAQRDMFQRLHLLLAQYVILGNIFKTDYAHKI